MKFKIKGNYYFNSFHLPQTTGPLAVENIIHKNCPADLNLKLWECPVDYRDVDKSIQSAIHGFSVWKKTSLADRAKKIEKYGEEISNRKNEFAEALSFETGKPHWSSLEEVNFVLLQIETALKNTAQFYSNNAVELDKTTIAHTKRRPLGPTLIIGSAIRPLEILNGNLLAALLSGNSIILKSSDKVAYSAQLLVECTVAAHFPEGTINLVQGDAEVSRRLLKEKGVKVVSFTGSKEIGKKIIDATHNDLTKLVAVNLSSKNVAIVHADADLNLAQRELLQAAFNNAGQDCLATSLVAIHRSLLDTFIPQFHALAKKIIIDHPTEASKEPFMGPLIDQAAVDAYLLYMGMAKREGIEEIMRGKQIDKSKKGYFVSPSIHLSEKWKPESHFLQSEIIGPNITFIPYDTIEEAIQIANATEFGLACSIFTKSKDIYNQCAEELDVGLFNLNISTLHRTPLLTTCAIKNSGNHRATGPLATNSFSFQLSGLETKDGSQTHLPLRGLE